MNWREMRLINTTEKLPKKGKFIGYVIVECTEWIESSVYFNGNKMCRDAVRSGEWCSRSSRSGWLARMGLCVAWWSPFIDSRRREEWSRGYVLCRIPLSHLSVYLRVPYKRIYANNTPPAKVAAPCNLARIRNRFACLIRQYYLNIISNKYSLVFLKKFENCFLKFSFDLLFEFLFFQFLKNWNNDFAIMIHR